MQTFTIDAFEHMTAREDEERHRIAVVVRVPCYDCSCCLHFQADMFSHTVTIMLQYV
jgi:hypothetical protein